MTLISKYTKIEVVIEQVIDQYDSIGVDSFLFKLYNIVQNSPSI